MARPDKFVRPGAFARPGNFAYGFGVKGGRAAKAAVALEPFRLGLNH